MLPNFKTPSLRGTRQEKLHNGFLHATQCVLTARTDRLEVAHQRYADALHGKEITGWGRKSHPMFSLPLTRECHDMQHAMKEREFWYSWGFDPDTDLSPLILGKKLWAARMMKRSPEFAVNIIRQHRTKTKAALASRQREI